MSSDGDFISTVLMISAAAGHAERQNSIATGQLIQAVQHYFCKYGFRLGRAL
jgi:hypothetical protein